MTTSNHLDVFQTIAHVAVFLLYAPLLALMIFWAWSCYYEVFQWIRRVSRERRVLLGFHRKPTSRGVWL